ncbi:MAG: GntR family transcriptional regulator [Deltaproteobacteria bacterium]|nr:GntR family transcriptional regulator [Deltaproteobacteria bacterium]
MNSKSDELELLSILKSGSQRYVKADVLAATAMREAIIKGALSPGQEIDEGLIAENLNLSRTPVRQGLGILEAEGLVKRPYRKGAIVTELSPDELEELYTIRSYIEGLAIRKAVPKYKKDHIQQLKTCLKTFIEKSDVANTYLDMNNRFHMMLYEPCEWDRLLNLITQLRNVSSRYMIVAHGVIMKHSPTNATHQDIIEACEQGDAIAAEKILQKHIRNMMRILIKQLS